MSLVYGDAIVSETINGKGETSFFEAEAGVEVLFHDRGASPTGRSTATPCTASQGAGTFPWR